MAKSLTFDVTFYVGEKTFVVPGLSAQEAFNLVHMPVMGELVIGLVPNWIEAPDALPVVSENKE